MNFKKFLRDNNLKQVDVATYLGVTKPQVSRVAKGYGKFAPANMEKLLNNDKGWLTGALLEDDIEDEFANPDIPDLTPQQAKALEEYSALIHRQLDICNEQIAKMDAQIARLYGIIEKMIENKQ